MDILKEISRIPNFGYVFLGDDGKEHIAVLGGFSCPKTDGYDSWKNILRISDLMQGIYSKQELTIDDKKELARLMDKMHTTCQSRKTDLYSKEEQQAYLNERSSNEIAQIEKQLQMHLDCRGFYRDYIFRK